MGIVALYGLGELTRLFNEFKLITFTVSTFFAEYHSETK